MGIKLKVKKRDIPKRYRKYKLIETTDGISDSVYLLDDKYVLKIFENGSKNILKAEKKLLKHLNKNSLRTPLVIDQFKILGKYCLVYSFIKGKSVKKTKEKYIIQIGEFLNKFHKISKKIDIKSKQSFSKKQLQKMIKKSNNQNFLKIYNKLDIKLHNDGIIHGDIFPDNVKFKNYKLSGVYDFGDACSGDFLFDLAVVALSWCSDKKDIKVLLNSYDKKLSYKSFESYMLYAMLYYCVRRDINNRDFSDLYNKFGLVDKILSTNLK